MSRARARAFSNSGRTFDPAADLLGEDALAVGALQGVDLDLQLLLRGRTARVADPDRGGGQLRLGGGDRRARLPRRSGAAVGGDGDGQFLAQRGHEDEAGGVVSRGDDVSGRGQVGEDAVRAALSDSQAGSGVPQPGTRILGDAQQDPGVIGQEAPALRPHKPTSHF
jgi:hypothetical protein